METKSPKRKSKTAVKKPTVVFTNGHTNGHANGNGHSNGQTNGHSADEDKIDGKRLLQVLKEVKNGNFSVRLPVDETGLYGKICDRINEIISLNEDQTREF